MIAWDAFRVILKGRSFTDVPALNLKNESEAYQFALTYGFDLFNPERQKEVWKTYNDALHFIMRILCRNPEQFPESLKDPENFQNDFRKVLALASGQEVETDRAKFEAKIYQPWACAILRVMHTLIHLSCDVRLRYLNRVKKETIHRFEGHLQRVKDQEGERLYLGFESDKIELVALEKKEGKLKESAVLKLLHKPENVAQEIYDYLGIRFVTKSKADIIPLLQYLLDHHLIVPANIMPSRCRNSLIDQDQLERVLEKWNLDSDAKSIIEFLQSCETDWILKENGTSSNPFSAEDYRTIQFTYRTLIRIPLKIRKQKSKSSGEADIRRSDLSFFFPFEIQIVDEKTWKDNSQGEANHRLYKTKQLKAVRERILKGIEI